LHQPGDDAAGLGVGLLLPAKLLPEVADLFAQVVGWSVAPGRLVGCARSAPPKTTNTRPPSRTVVSVPRLMRLLTASALIPNADAASGTVSLRPGAWPVPWSVGPGRPVRSAPTPPWSCTGNPRATSYSGSQ